MASCCLETFYMTESPKLATLTVHVHLEIKSNEMIHGRGWLKRRGKFYYSTCVWNTSFHMSKLQDASGLSSFPFSVCTVKKIEMIH